MPRPYECVVGTYAGTGAAVTVENSIGFRPKYLKVWNETDGDECWEYFDGMTAAYAFRTVDSGSGTTDLSKITSNGCTLTNRGFIAGTTLSENAKTYRFVAFP